MTAIQTQLDKATQAVKERLMGDFKLSEIPDIAEMIQSIQTLERYSRQFEIPEETEEETEEEFEEAAPEDADFLDHARDELEDSNMYYEYWLETKDEALREIARDELRHSEYWLARAKQEDPNSQELAELKAFHNSVLAKLI